MGNTFVGLEMIRGVAMTPSTNFTIFDYFVLLDDLGMHGTT
jgi:hypothetical protein